MSSNQTSLMATLVKSPIKASVGKVKSKRVRTVSRKRTKDMGYQLLLFQAKETTETEKLIYLFWDAIKRRRIRQFNDAIHGLAQWLSAEQFDCVIRECKRHLVMDDKAWLLVALEGHRLSPLSLLLQSHGEKHLLLNGNGYMALIVVLFFIKWRETKEVVKWENS